MLFDFFLNFLITFIFPFLLMIGLYLYLKPYYLKHDPVLKEYNIGAAIAIPLLTIAFFAANYFFNSSMELDFDSVMGPQEWKIEFWNNLLSSTDDEEDMYNIFLKMNKLNLIFFIVMLVGGLYLVYGLFHKSNCSASKLKKTSIYYSILPTLYFFINIYIFLYTLIMSILDKTTRSSAEKISVVMLLISLVITIIAYVKTYKKYNTSVENIFEYGDKDYIPLPFSSNAQPSSHQTANALDNNVESSSTHSTATTNESQQKSVLSFSDQLIKLKELLDNGILTQEEFDNEKKKILNS